MAFKKSQVKYDEISPNGSMLAKVRRKKRIQRIPGDFFRSRVALGYLYKVADLSSRHFRKQSATDGTKPDLNIGETRVWPLDSGPNLQPCCHVFRNIPGSVP